MEDVIINKVASSGLVSLDLEDLWPSGERVEYDLAQHLWQGLVLRETEFRETLKQTNWQVYAGKHVAVTCSADAIVPTWAFMLLATKLQPVAATVVFGTLEILNQQLMREVIMKLPQEDYRGAKVVIKGCSKVPMPTAAYVDLSNHLLPVVQSLMFGEPCSTVPLYKKAKQA